jgi:hypothetical protein
VGWPMGWPAGCYFFCSYRSAYSWRSPSGQSFGCPNGRSRPEAAICGSVMKADADPSFGGRASASGISRIFWVDCQTQERFAFDVRLPPKSGLKMALTFGFNTARDLLEKLEREAALLRDDGVTADRFMNFVQTGYALIDWIKNDTAVPAAAKGRSVITGLYNDRTLKVCGDLANSVKHFTLTKRQPITTATAANRGFGVGRFGMGGFGEGEQEIIITLSDGTVMNALNFVQDVLATWNQFFLTHKI